MTFLVPLVLLFATIPVLVLWLLKQHEEPAVILTKLHPHETDSLERFSPREAFDFLADDREFWAASKGWDGLKRKRYNAVLLVHFCQGLHPTTEEDLEELRLMTARAILISFYTGCSLLESVPRWFIRDFPHSCARTATNLYWDMERRTTTLCSVYRPELLDRLHQIL